MCSHLHHIFLSSYLQIFRSSHLHIFSLSLSPLLSLPLSLSLCLLPSVTVPLLLFLVSLKSAGSANQAKRSGHFRSSVGTKCIFFLDFSWSGGNLFARNEVRVSKTAVKLRFWSVETRFECQKLRSNCDFGWSGRSPFARNVVRASKTNAFLPFWSVGGNPRQKRLFFFCNFGWSGGYPFARNEVRVSKTAVQLAATLSHETRFASKTTGFLRVWLVRRLPFRTKRGSSVKNWGFLVSLVGPVKGSACTSACV